MEFREIVWKVLHATGSGHGSVMGFCEYGNEPSGSIKGGEFLD
jgi:hypothetical protein